MNHQRLSLHIEGVVQGVGFRPFLYKLALDLGITGWVKNGSDGVYLEIEGNSESLDLLIEHIHLKKPPVARIDTISKKEIPVQFSNDFLILTSQDGTSQSTLISPDIAMCNDCEGELYESKNLRFHYPFINCTNCGPRFTIIKEVPYDRNVTTMNSFELCDYCTSEYVNPENRRFHAEPVACERCGPLLEWVDVIEKDQFESNLSRIVISRAVQRLWQGGILGLKGLGGFHFACLATDEKAVNELRSRKKRPYKPFAVMFRNLSELKKYCSVSEDEIKLLLSIEKPILLLKKIENSFTSQETLFQKLADSIAPSLNEIGAFLPYTPLHSLLFEIGGFPALVMTSGNLSEEPIEIDNHTATHHLSTIADGFILHNREIWNRCDDSVGYVFHKNLVLTRRSRGFAPLPIQVQRTLRPTLAVGAQYCNTISLASKNQVFLSQHIGDVNDEMTLSFLEETFLKLSNWLRIDPELIVIDLHPNLLPTQFAKSLFPDREHKPIQHHHAHFASVLASHGVNEPCIGVIFDGTGFGTDRTIWGGEFFIGDFDEVLHTGKFLPFPLLGGDSTIKKPYRTALSFLLNADDSFPVERLPFANATMKNEIQFIQHFLKHHSELISTSSVGRLFDVVSSILGICHYSTYEGQAAIELEHTARKINKTQLTKSIPAKMDVTFDSTQWLIDPRAFVLSLANAALEGVPKEVLAYQFHQAIVDGTFWMIDALIEKFGKMPVAFGGGVFQNRLLLDLIVIELDKRSIRGLLPNQIPVNDGGISLGQILLGNSKTYTCAS